MAFDVNARLKEYVSTKTGSATVDTPKIESVEKNKGFDLGKALISPFTTTFDIFEDVASGAVKSIEGIADIGLGLLGSAASIFGSNDIEKALTEAAKYDFTGNTIGKIDDWAEESSMLSGDNWASNTIHQVGQGVGGMLPSIAVGIATGGLGTIATVAPTATFTLGAAGQSTEEALNKGANIGQATAYGALSGATEGLLEAVSPTKLFMPGAAGKLASGGLKKLAGTFVEEGVEEVLSDLITPAWEAITYSGKYETPEIKDLIQTFSVGGLTALAMGGGAKASNIAMYGKDGEKALNKYNEILELNQEEYDLETKGELTKNLRDKYAERRQTLVQEFADQTQKLDKNVAKTQRVYATIGEQSATEFNSGQKLAQELQDLHNKRTNDNLQIKFTEHQSYDAYYDRKNNILYLDKNSEKPYIDMITHELGHVVENNAKYNDIKNDVLSMMTEDEIAKEKEILKGKYQNKYNADGTVAETYTAEQLDDLVTRELVANYIGQNILKDYKTAKKIISNNRSLGEKVLDFVKDKINSLNPNNKSYKELKNIENKLQEILDSYDTNDISNAPFDLQASMKDAFIKNKYYESSYKKLIDEGIDVEKALSKIYNKYESGKRKYKNSSIIQDGYLIFYDIQDNAPDITEFLDLYTLKEGAELTSEEFSLFKKLIDEIKWNGGNFNGELIDALRRVGKTRPKGRQDYNAIIESARKEALDRVNGLSGETSTSNGERTSKVVAESLDSKGKELSEQQKEYFKDSLVRNDEGNLLITYHGTNSDFTTFDHKFMGQSGTSYGYGFYFTDNAEVASGYGNAKPYFLNITKPISNAEQNIAKSELKKLLRAIDSDGNGMISDFDDVSMYGYEKVLEKATNQLIESNTNDLDIISEIININGGGTSSKEIYKILKDTLGYDGVIGKYHTGDDLFVVFNSNQIKNTYNKNPTSYDDTMAYRKSKNPPEGQMELELDFEGAEKNALRESIKKDTEKVKTKTPRTNETIAEKVKTAKEKIDEFYQNRNDYLITMQIQLTNSFAGVETRAREFFTKQFEEEGLTGNELKAKVQEEITKLKALENRAMKADAIANYMIKNELYDGIWKEIVDSGKANLFETYKLHRLNIKRMRYEYLDPKKEAELRKQFDEGKIDETTLNMRLEEAKEIKEKPVFGVETTAEESEKKVKLLEEENPEFKKWHEKIAAYNNKLMDMREEAGIVSKAQREFITKNYGDDYVPTYRELENGATKSGLTGNGKIGVAKGLHAAKGSDLDIQSIMLSMSEQTLGVNRQTLMNKLFLEIQRIAPDAFEEIDIQRQNRNDMEGKIEPKPNEVYFYKNGQRVTYKTTDDIAAAFSVLRSNKNSIDGKQSIENSMVGKGLEKLVSLMKKYTTEYNPFFAIRNLFRDASDTFIYTKYSPNLIKRYNRALKEIRNNGEYYQLYLKNGGEGNSFFDKEYGINLTKKNALLEKITYVNEITELMPRLSEFMESIDAHYDGDLKNVPADVADVAMLEASEVTVNFARGGTLTKKLNKYLMPYLNASVQGWCKTWNTFVHPESMRAWGMSMAKITLMSLPTLLFNEIFYDDDEEYQQLSDDVKGSYFLLKVGNNKFIRIPRGRVEAVMGDAMQRIYRTAKGGEDAFKGYVENTLKNVSPVDNLTRTIISPFTDVATNTTWYGGQIENRSMQALPINERYDANTSEIAKMLNKVVPTISPKKWHYLLDQYSGILGDVVLPLTSKNKDLSGISGITVNSLENNKYTDKFYKTLEEVERDRNSTNGTAVDKAKMRYLNKMNTKISDLYKEKKATDDKETQTAIQTMIVKLQRDALEGVKEFEKTLKKYEYGLSQEELYDDYYREANRECFGAEVALMDHDNRVYEKATIFNKCGINWDTFYNIYFDAQDIMPDYDADGDVVSGSKKTKITNYVKRLNLTATQKYMVMGLLGYKNTNGEQQVRSLLRSKGYNGEELNKIMKMCGYN